MTRGSIRVLDGCALRTLLAARLPTPLRKYRGEVDLIGGDRDVLGFIDVKTRTSRDVKTAEAAVDRRKRREIAPVAGDHLRRVPASQWRFDVVSVYYDGSNSRPQIEVFRNASLAA